ncbi:hypothetical protein SSX86_011281 [Deinandra increscens subsp. villosa]|uniref:Cytochrome P450 n=1 Tax=Deinandra increscens subsp. villosa TaxID=3103831 RepID=A0AAP0DAG6_9ASTR
MEFFRQFLPFIVFLLSVVLFRYKISNKRKTIKLAPPEPSGALPFVGHLHHLHSPEPVARTLAKMADNHGSIFALRLGSQRAMVVSSWQMVKECFSTNDRNFASRPNMAVSRYMGYNSAVFALAPYGPYWREIRKLVVLELLTSQRLEKHKNVRYSEVRYLINELYSLTGFGQRVVNMTEWFEHVTFNIIVRMLAGKRFSFSSGCKDEDLQVKEAIKKGLYLSGVFVVSDVIPCLEWMDIGGHVKAMKQAAKELDVVLGKWVDEHVEKRKKSCGSNEDRDFMDVMLSSLSEDDNLFGHGGQTVIKATTLILILTGSESTAETLTWALSLLLNHPHILKAAQKELDIHVGRKKWAKETDIKNLVYLQAIVKETLRMYPPAPLAGPRQAIEDCNIGGYHVTKGTRLIVNVWKLHRDPQVWSDPNEFRPERFLEKHSNINYQGQNFEYIPFSSGRRMCPASSFALEIIHLTLARLLQGFYVTTPMEKPVDMSEGLGIALPKVKPLEVVITPRLSHELY